MMPGMDGYEVCRKLKDNPATRDIPIIFLTAKTDEVDEEKGFDVGAVDYIHKPFSAPIVLAGLRRSLPFEPHSQKRRWRAIRPTSCSMRFCRKRPPTRLGASAPSFRAATRTSRCSSAT